MRVDDSASARGVARDSLRNERARGTMTIAITAARAR
jgi:hypothetical protein